MSQYLQYLALGDNFSVSSDGGGSGFF
jgi:hypothetical protein